ncbi:MAG TPA: MEDS domain-containing protein [Noviherbaspirillum sp.]
MDNPSIFQQQPEGPAATEHIAQLYRNNAELAHVVGDFIVEGLRRGEAVLVIATAAHWALFVSRLARYADIDLAGAIVNGQLRIMDAELALAAIMADNLPQWHHVHQRAKEIIESCSRRYGTLRVYGEMVNLLWSKENRVGAEMLEGHWNAIAHRYPVRRLCAYRMEEEDGENYNALLRCVCRTHARVLPPPGRPDTRKQCESGRRGGGAGSIGSVAIEL